jgi:hypothetical protein
VRLNKSLYGLNQAPRNFFLHLKAKLCLVYVDDTLFFSPKEEYIDIVVQQLRDNEMELEVEGEVAGFLGVHMARNDNNTKITLTQTGLVKRNIESVGVLHLPIKSTPANHVPLIKDEDGDKCDSHFNYQSIIGMLRRESVCTIYTQPSTVTQISSHSHLSRPSQYNGQCINFRNFTTTKG